MALGSAQHPLPHAGQLRLPSMHGLRPALVPHPALCCFREPLRRSLDRLAKGADAVQVLVSQLGSPHCQASWWLAWSGRSAWDPAVLAGGSQGLQLKARTGLHSTPGSHLALWCTGCDGGEAPSSARHEQWQLCLDVSGPQHQRGVCVHFPPGPAALPKAKSQSWL